MLPADLGILRLATKSLLGSYSVPSDVLRDSALLRGAVQTFHATPDISILPEVDEATARLSASAGLLATLLGNAKTEPASITATMPVLAQAPAEIAPPLLAGLLAAALQRAITHSGLFYEAHLAQWVEGSGAPCGASAAHDASPLFVPPRDCGGLPRLPLSSARRRD